MVEGDQKLVRVYRVVKLCWQVLGGSKARLLQNCLRPGDAVVEFLGITDCRARRRR